jgi:hypothetical protein
MRIQSLLAAAAMAVVASASAMSASASELITNGDFSAHSAGWSVSSNTYNFLGESYNEANVGGEGSISQTFTDLIGGVLTREYDWSGSGYQYVQFNGATVAGSLTQATSGHYSFVLGPGSGSDTIAFLGRNDPSYNFLDNVSITQVGGSVGGVPEPASWALMLAGFLGAGGAIRSNRRRAAAA